MRIPSLPVFYGQKFSKRHLRLERSFRLNEIETIGDTVDMNVDTDRGQVKADRYRQICGLASDSGQFAEFLNRMRQHASELLS